jgi:tetratricopeptide (TPR) repeat protein
MNYSKSYYLQLRSALRFLSDKTYGAYGFAMTDYQGLIPKVMQELMQLAKDKGLHIKEIWLKKREEADFMTQISQALPCDGLVVRNFSEYFYLTNDRNRLDAIAMRSINFAREAILELQIPIIFWLEKESFGNLANFATDFYAQRMGSTLYFTDKPENREKAIRTPDFEFIDEKELSLDIALYESQLADYPEAQRIEDVVFPLIEAYLTQGKMLKAMEYIAYYIPNPESLAPESQLRLADIYFRAEEKYKAEQLLQNLKSRKDLTPTLYSRLCFLLAKVIDSDYNRFAEAFPYLQEALQHYKIQPLISEKQVSELGMLYNDLINRLWEYGRLPEALEYAIKMQTLFQQKYEESPANVRFKNGLAISYSKLGETHTSLGNLEKALAFYEERSRLGKELYEAYPANVSFKNGLAISYSKLGETHTSLGNLEKALAFYEYETDLFKELYEDYPANASFKNGLAISYSKLGDTHTSLGNLEKALAFYEDRSRLGKELYEAYSENVSFKNGLAISYSKLGETHTSLGNLEKALAYYEDDSQLTKELYEAYPTNVSFKNGLAVSYHKLGIFYRDNVKEKEKAKNYFIQVEKLLQELVVVAPLYAEFQNNLKEVQDDLKSL